MSCKLDKLEAALPVAKGSVHKHKLVSLLPLCVSAGCVGKVGEGWGVPSADVGVEEKEEGGIVGGVNRGRLR